MTAPEEAPFAQESSKDDGPKRQLLLNPGDQLDGDEREFVHLQVLMGMTPTDSYRAVFYDERGNQKSEWRGTTEALRGGAPHRVAERMLRNKTIALYKRFLEESNDVDLALANARSTLLRSADQKDATAAAASILKLEEKRSKGLDGAARWLEVMLSLDGVEVRKPVPDGASHVDVTFADLVEGRAYLHLPFAAKVELLHRAGAPWNEYDPNARLSDLQLELLAREERWQVVHGGSGVGKSVLGGCKLLLEVVIPFTKSAVLADTYGHCHDEFKYAYQGFRQLFGADGACGVATCVNKQQQHNMTIQTIWGSTVDCFSADYGDGDQVLGKEFDLIVVGEAAKLSADTFQRKAIRALNRRIKNLQDSLGSSHVRRTGRACMYTTPDGYGGAASETWDTADRLSGKKPHLLRLDAENPPDYTSSYYLREAAVTENPSYSEEARKSAERDLPRDIYEEQYLGLRVRRSGLIYKEFKRDKHLVPLPPNEEIRQMKLCVSFDTGKHFSGGLQGYHPSGRIYRLAEYCAVEQTIQANMDGLGERICEVLAPAFGIAVGSDPLKTVLPALFDRIAIYIVDGQSEHKQEIMDHWPIALEDARYPVKGTIDDFRGLMKKDRYYVCESYVHDEIDGYGFLNEVKDYVWRAAKDVKGGGEARSVLEPTKKRDHSMDESRYGIKVLLEEGPPSKQESEVTFGQNWENAHGLAGLEAAMKKQAFGNKDSQHIGSAYRNVHGW